LDWIFGLHVFSSVDYVSPFTGKYEKVHVEKYMSTHAQERVCMARGDVLVA